ncbi:ABC transporter substrate-binding protein [Cohnella sp. WQ 127256]|uniref:ABC transporter substrate-binding protein n=1 Tax=Cohnella sp. WQ 127256 TaxID=2938790 RepID=UPI0021197564|nr:extracellular solute-binding protein [Cohnella sp. WQ 127256]
MNRIRAVAIFLSLLILLQGCIGSTEQSDLTDMQDDRAGSISMWAFATDNEDIINEAFNNKYPNIQIDVLPVSWGDYDGKFRIAMTFGSDLPDIVTVESYWWGKWLSMNDTFEDLSQYGIDSSLLSPFVSDIIRGPNGELNVIPVSIGIGCLWYRKDLAKKYFGTTDSDELEQKFKTWDDILAAGELIRQQSKGRDFLFPNTMALEEFLLASHNDYVSGNVLDLSGKVLPMFKLIDQMMNKGYIAKVSGMELDNSYIQGNILFYPFADWYAPQIKGLDINGEGKWGVLKPPGGGFYRGGYGYAIPKKSKSENKALAAERIKFILTQEGSGAVLKTNQFSTYINAFTQERIAQIDPYFKVSLLDKFFHYSQTIQQPLRYNKFDDIINKELRIQSFNMMVSGISAEKAVNNAKIQIEQKLGNELIIK